MSTKGITSVDYFGKLCGYVWFIQAWSKDLREQCPQDILRANLWIRRHADEEMGMSGCHIMRKWNNSWPNKCRNVESMKRRPALKAMYAPTPCPHMFRRQKTIHHSVEKTKCKRHSQLEQRPELQFCKSPRRQALRPNSVDPISMRQIPYAIRDLLSRLKCFAAFTCAFGFGSKQQGLRVVTFVNLPPSW